MNPITEMNISLHEIDARQEIDRTRAWYPILDELDESQYGNAVFVGFRAGDSPSMAADVEYEDPFTETLWVYKTRYTIKELIDGDISPQELFEEIEFKQPNIEVVGLAKYVRDLSPD